MHLPKTGVYHQELKQTEATNISWDTGGHLFATTKGNAATRLVKITALAVDVNADNEALITTGEALGLVGRHS